MLASDHFILHIKCCGTWRLEDAVISKAFLKLISILRNGSDEEDRKEGVRGARNREGASTMSLIRSPLLVGDIIA